MENAMLTVRNLRFAYDEYLLFDDLSLSLPAGKITALIGANGAGKSTLMNCIAGTQHPFSGDIIVDGMTYAQEGNQIRRSIGYLPDNFGLFPQLTARQHLEYAAAAQQQKNANAIEQAIAVTNLAELLDKLPTALSRGQRQRVGIAMTLVHQPRFILLDEPASGLDPVARSALSQLLKELAATGATLLVSSHILTELRDYATHYIIMDKGRIIRNGDLSDSLQWRLTVIEAGAQQRSLELLASNEVGSEVSHLRLEGEYIYFSLPATENSSDLLRQLIMADIAVAEFTRIGTDIEQLYQQSIQ